MAKQNNDNDLEVEDLTVTDIDSELMAEGKDDVSANSDNDCSVQESSSFMECGIDNTEQTETAENVGSESDMNQTGRHSDTEWNLLIDEEFEENWSEYDSDTVEEETQEEEDSEANLVQKLGLWASAHNITIVALSALLSVLRVHHPSLPKHPKTLLKTPRQFNIKTVEGGSYYHFGLVS